MRSSSGAEKGRSSGNSTDSLAPALGVTPKAQKRNARKSVFGDLKNRFIGAHYSRSASACELFVLAKQAGEKTCKPDSVSHLLILQKFRTSGKTMVIPLGPSLRTWLVQPTHPAFGLSADPSGPLGETRVSSRAYLVLLHGEIASFHLPRPLKERGTRLCGSNPPLTRDGCYPFRCPVESGLSSRHEPLAGDHPVFSPA